MGNYAKFVGRLGRNEASDECYTPRDRVKPLWKFIDPTKTYYEATSGKSSQLLDGLQSMGVDIRPSGDKDFFECGPDDVFDGVITNPPYSKKDKFIKHCYYLGKPFALLLPVAAFQGQTRGEWFMNYGVSALVYNKRIDFTGKKSPTFGVAWFMGNNFCEPNRLWFCEG
jgi:hypothetical protein